MAIFTSQLPKHAAAKAIVLAYVASLVPQVVGHGFVQTVDAGGRSWQGFDESTWTNKAQGSAVLITDYEIPSYDVYAREIACGINPQAAQNIASVSPGDSIGWHWVTHNGANYKSWTHNEGTHRAFIGPCIGDCGSTDPTQVQWTELSAQYTGQQTWDGSTWPVRTLADGNPWYDKVPPVPNGDYLIRNELTALHYSTLPYSPYDEGLGHGQGTEFYITCMAIRVGGSDGSYNMDQAVTFPGAYTVNQQGHYNPNLWSDPGSVVISSLNTFQRSQGTTGDSNSSNNSDSNNDNGNSGNDNGSGNTGGSSEEPSSPSPSNGVPTTTTTTTATIANPVCKRRKRSLSSALGRRRHLRQARRSGH